MWVGILEIAGALLIPLIKIIFESIAKKKLSDKEFVAYVLAHQSKRARAGKSALDANAALDEALRELEEEELKNNASNQM